MAEDAPDDIPGQIANGMRRIDGVVRKYSEYLALTLGGASLVVSVVAVVNPAWVGEGIQTLGAAVTSPATDTFLMLVVVGQLIRMARSPNTYTDGGNAEGDAAGPLLLVLAGFAGAALAVATVGDRWALAGFFAGMAGYALFYDV